MNLILVLKILAITVVGLLFLLTAYKTLKAVKGKDGFIYLLFEILIFSAIGFGAQWGVTQSFIKIELRDFSNTPLLRSERLVVKGSVRNVGKYKASSVTLHVKVVNNASGGSFSSTSDRPQKLSFDVVVARNLRRGSSRGFSKSFKYPPYFKLANISAYISYN